MIARQAAKAAGPLARDVASGAHCALSFSPDTQVATPNGEQAIGTLQVGDQVTAYDPQTGQTRAQPVLHVWINHDTDLADVTLRSDANASQPSAAASDAKVRETALKAHGLRAPPDDQADVQATGDTQALAHDLQRTQLARSTSQATRDEKVHTTAKHPWLTTDHGFVPVAQLHVGERVVREDSRPATIVSLRVVRGEADYYNLEVAHLHTFAVGVGKYIVHNCGGNLAAAADQEAKEIGGKVVPRGLPQRWANVAVGYLRDAGGNVRRVVAMNENAGSGWFKALQREVPANEILPRFKMPHLFGMKGFHAEDYILHYAKKTGMELIGIGSDSNVCSRCWNRIVKRWSSSVIGTARGD